MFSISCTPAGGIELTTVWRGHWRGEEILAVILCSTVVVHGCWIKLQSTVCVPLSTTLSSGVLM